MINSFKGQYSFLSNFHKSEIYYEGRSWPTVEHLYQALKSLDTNEQKLVRQQGTPGQAKRAGRKIHLRSDWEDIKNDIMLMCLRLKFNKRPFAKMLAETKDQTLVEGNYWHDNYWGNCGCNKCKDIPGQNWLGKLLMQVREEVAN